MPSFYSQVSIKIFVLFLTFIFNVKVLAQELPAYRKYEWHKAGLLNRVNNSADSINLQDYGLVNDGQTDNSNQFHQAILDLGNTGGTIYIPNGNFYLSDPIYLNSNVTLRGAKNGNTQLIFQLNPGERDLINVEGKKDSVIYFLNESVSIFNKKIVLQNGEASNFQQGDYLKISKNDTDLVYSPWGKNTVAQIVEIEEIEGDSIFLTNQIRTNYPIDKQPKIEKIFPIKNVGIECLSILRLDTQTVLCANIDFRYAVNCCVKGVVSKQCNFSHVNLINSTNVEVSNSYFKDGLLYGEGGQGYGIVPMYSSGECLIQNNIFEHLRHSILLQAGPNGNVISYNYSFDPYWEQQSFPNDAAGDLVLHGNYPYANLFEGNICQNIVIDESHGINGPHNTFFRNRANTYGLVMSSNFPTDSCNFIGNEITSNGLFQGLYSLNGVGHFQYGNNVKNILKPSGSSASFQASLYLNVKPPYLQENQFPFSGAPAIYNQEQNSAKIRFGVNNFSICEAYQYTSINKNSENLISIFPNPSSTMISFAEEAFVLIYDTTGKLVYKSEKKIKTLNVSAFLTGMYIVYANNKIFKFIKE